MARRRVVPLFVIGAVALAACGIDVVGQLGAGDGGAPSPDGSLATDGAGGDSKPSTSPDAGGDANADAKGDAGDDGATVPPACGVGQVSCGGACITATDCRACASAKYLCAPTRRCVASCASCTDLVSTKMPIECIACDDNQSNPIGTCGYNSTAGFCLNGSYSLAYPGSVGEHCDCSNTDVANCLGASQVCKPNGGTDWCITCGEFGQGTNGFPCKGGGTCNTGVSPPRCM